MEGIVGEWKPARNGTKIVVGNLQFPSDIRPFANFAKFHRETPGGLVKSHHLQRSIAT